MTVSIDALLNPASVAVVGASADPTKRGYKAIQTLLDAGYDGEIYPVNQKEAQILGLRCYPAIDALPGAVDLALLYTPAKVVPEVVEQCGRKGIGGVAVIASGFAESGAAGRALEDQVIDTARRHGIRVLGPNINGLFSARRKFNAIGWHDIPCGDIALLCNSGNIPLSILIDAQTQQAAGFSLILSVGNQGDLQFHDYLDSLGSDAGTRAVVSYIEGLKSGRAYLDVARKVAARKAVVVYKAGRNAVGARAARSHTGSLAGDHAVACAVLKQAGVTVVDRSDTLFPVAEALSLFPPMRSRRVAIVSEGGGVLTIASERLAERGLVVQPFSEDTRRRIAEILPNSTTISNPVDVGSGTLPSARNYGLCAQAILEDPDVDALLFVGYFGGYARRYAKARAAIEGEALYERQICETLGPVMRRLGKPIIVQCYYAHAGLEALRVLRTGGVPYCRSVEVAVDCLAAAADYADARRRLAQTGEPRHIARNAAAGAIIDACRAQGRSALLEPEARDLLGACGIPVPPHRMLHAKSDIDALPADWLKRPMALKIVSVDVPHKSDAGGVMLDVTGEDAMRAAYDRIRENVLRYRPGADIAGVLVSPMIAEPGTEVLVGASHDPQFGPVILFGLGGIHVEVLRDVAIRAVPLGEQDARDMLVELKGKALLDGMRGMPPADRDTIVDLILGVSALCAAYPEIAELDLNPVVAGENGCSIADARIILRA